MAADTPFVPQLVSSVHMPARDIPMPTTISAQAQFTLSMLSQVPKQVMPPQGDAAGWDAYMALRAPVNEQITSAMALATTGVVVPEVASTVERLEFGTASVYVATPFGTDTADPRIFFNIHGGGFTDGGGVVAEQSTQYVAGSYGVRTWGMDYRMLPQHPYPAGLDDCMIAYRELLKVRRPEDIAVGGLSAGANLTAALLLRAHSEGLPMPAAAVLYSIPGDLTQSGDTYQTNRFMMASDGLGLLGELYAGDHDIRNPLVSPLFADYPADFPPTILIAGTRDFLLSDTSLLHRKLRSAGVRTELFIFEGAPHGGFGGRAPEDHEQVEIVRSFLEREWTNSGNGAEA